MRSKKEKLFGGTSKLRASQEKPLVDKEEMSKQIKSPTSRYMKALFVLERRQNEELNTLVKQVNQIAKRDINKSLLVRMGIDIVKEKDPQDILRIINGI